MTTTNVIDVLKEIKNVIGDKKAYLYGTTVRKILSNETPEVFNIFVRVHHAENRQSIFEKLPNHPKIFYTLGTSISINDVITANMLYVNLEDIISGNIEVQSFQQGLKDYNKKSIKFTKEVYADMKPEHILRAIEITVDTDFHLDSKTITAITTNKALFDNMPKRKFYQFIRDSISHKKTRKIISLCNTLGISRQVIGLDMVEASVLNHMKPADVLELLAVIFSNVPSEHLKEILVDSCGLHERDTGHVINLSKALELIRSNDNTSAREVLNIIEKKRIVNVVRLLKELGYKELSKEIKIEKESVVTVDELCIDAELIHNAFGIDNPDIVAILLEKAIQRVIEDPAFNNQTKILNYLNTERETINNG